MRKSRKSSQNSKKRTDPRSHFNNHFTNQASGLQTFCQFQPNNNQHINSAREILQIESVKSQIRIQRLCIVQQIFRSKRIRRPILVLGLAVHQNRPELGLMAKLGLVSCTWTQHKLILCNGTKDKYWLRKNKMECLE